MKKWQKRTIRGGILVFVFVFLPCLVIYGAAQRCPGFYQNALNVSGGVNRENGEEFETQILNLQNDILSYSKWQANFTDDQINGWLAIHLREKFPGALSEAIDRPRVAFFDRQLQIVFRIEYGIFSGYVHIVGDVFCPDTTENQIAFRIVSARLGILPIPMSMWADQMTESLNQSGIATMWDEVDGDPVALVTVPSRLFTDETRKFKFVTIALSDGQMQINGISETVEQ